MPVPATAEPRSRSSRQNRSQIRSRSAAGIPGPWSSTQMRARRPRSLARNPTVMVCSSEPYFTALSSKLRSIWRSASASTGATSPSCSSVARATPRAAASGVNASTV